MRPFGLLLAGSVAALAIVGCAGGNGTATTPGTLAVARWVITDLGTLGGGDSKATAINDHGEIVGLAYTKAKGGHEKWHAFLWKNGRMRDLGTLGGPNSEALAINNRGQIVGWADTKAKDKIGEPISHAFLWENGRMRDLGVTLGGPESAAYAINERGQIAGWAATKALDKYAYPGTHARHVFLWQEGKSIDLGTFGGPNSVAYAINNRGQIVGSADTKTVHRSGENRGLPISQAFLWQNGKMRELGTLGGPSGAALALNERGQVVGWADTSKVSKDVKYGVFQIEHAFLWRNGAMRDLTPRGPHTSADGINDHSQVVGAFDFDPTGYDSPERAVLWQGGKRIELGTIGLASRAVAINERGWIVGSSDTRSWDTHAVLWTLKRG